MLYRRKTYKIEPPMYETFTQLFHTYLLPNQLTHGAQLVGRWVNEELTEIMALWLYDSRAHYETVDAAEFLQYLRAGTEQKVISIDEQHPRAGVF